MPRTWKLFEPCTVEEYKLALLETRRRISSVQLRMLQTQYAAPDKTVTAPQLAHAVGYSSHPPVNSQYGRLGRLIAEVVGRSPTAEWGYGNWWAVLSDGIGENSAGFQWVMHPQLVQALEELRWVEPDSVPLTEEIAEADISTFIEGAVRQVWVNTYERSQEARQACIDHYGAQCYACSFNFAEVYGSDGEGFIHVHHERPLSEIGETYRVDPITDLKPVCPNCHAMIHQRNPARSVSEVKNMLLKH